MTPEVTCTGLIAGFGRTSTPDSPASTSVGTGAVSGLSAGASSGVDGDCSITCSRQAAASSCPGPFAGGSLAGPGTIGLLDLERCCSLGFVAGGVNAGAATAG